MHPPTRLAEPLTALLLTGLTTLLAEPHRADAKTMDVDLPVSSISGRFTLSGQMPPASVYHRGLLFLRNESGDEIELGSTHDGQYEARVIPGRYDVHYSHVSGEGVMPINGDARIGKLRVPPPSGTQPTFDIDIPVARLMGQMLINGQAPPASDYHYGRLLLEDRATGDSIFLARTNQQSYEAILTPGNYDLVYEHGSGAAVPQNQHSRIGRVQLKPEPWLTVQPQPPLVIGFDGGVLAVPEPSAGVLALPLAGLLQLARRRRL